MLDPRDPIVELLDRDPRYKFEAYVFVFEALRYAQETLELGESYETGEFDENDEEQIERHVTGQDLCEAARQYALDQYGLMAKNVLGTWGIESTGDLGEIVFNLIDIGKMRKTEHDRRADFDDVFEFETALRQEFSFSLPDAGKGRLA